MSLTPDIRYSGDSRQKFFSAEPKKLTTTINGLRDFLLAAGWFKNGPGEFATGTITVLAIPFHFSPPGGEPENGALFRNLGFYAANPSSPVKQYFLYDPLSAPADPDPTTAGVVGVAVGFSANETIIHFAAQLSAHTDYACIPGNQDADGNYQSIIATARFPGPDYNDPSWTGDGANCFTQGIRLGGWNMGSAAYNNTQIMLKIVENSNIALAIKCSFGTDSSDDYVFNPNPSIRAIAGPYQFFFLEDKDSGPFPNRFMASVPYVFLPGVVSYAAFCTSGIPAGTGVTNSLSTSIQSAIKVTASAGQSGFKKGQYSGSGIQAISFYGIDSGSDGQNLVTSLGKSLITAPFLGLSIVDGNVLTGETRIVGQTWDSFLVTSYQELDTIAVIDNKNFLAVARNSGPITCTLYVAISNDLG